MLLDDVVKRIQSDISDIQTSIDSIEYELDRSDTYVTNLFITDQLNELSDTLTDVMTYTDDDHLKEVLSRIKDYIKVLGTVKDGMEHDDLETELYYIRTGMELTSRMNYYSDSEVVR